jgi:tetratricopeptide (TPR) repeat protein
VASLIDKSLLVRAQTSVVPTCPMYRMLETVRAYAVLELAASAERDDAYEGLVRYCTGEAALAASGLVGPAQVEWLDRVREDLESYRGALDWLIARGRASEAINIAWPLLFFWLIRGHSAEGLRWYEQIVRLPARTPPAESRALVGAGTMWYAQGDLERARDGLARARACADACGEPEILAQAENMLGFVELAIGDVDAARHRFKESRERFRALAVPWGTGQALSGLAWVALATGDPDGAEHLLADAVSEFRDVGPWFLALTRYLRALVAIRRGTPDEAVAHVRESLTDLRQLHDKFAFVYSTVPLAAAAAHKHDYESVARIIGVRDAISESTGALVVDPSTTDLREQAERDARAHLGPARWALAYAAGRKSSIDALLKDLDGIVARRAGDQGPAQ